MDKETLDKPKKRGNPNPHKLPPGPGRPKGIPNKTTTEFKEALVALMNYAAPNMVQWLEQIDDPAKRFDVMSKFAEFVIPKQARMEMSGPDGGPIEHTLQSNDQEIINRYLQSNSKSLGDKDGTPKS